MEQNNQYLEKIISTRESITFEVNARSLPTLKKHFENKMQNYSDASVLNIFAENYKRKFPLRTIWQEYDVTALPVFAPLITKEQLKEELLEYGFPDFALDIKTDWGQGTLEWLAKDVFNRFIVNDGKDACGYYVHGKIGTGKTTLLTGIAKMLYAILKIKPRYITMPYLVNLFTASAVFENKIIQQKAVEELDELQKCYFLFIDNMGFVANYTDRQLQHSMEFFYHRYTKRLPVFIGTNTDIRVLKKDDINKQNQFYLQLTSWMKDSDFFHKKIIHFNNNDRRN